MQVAELNLCGNAIREINSRITNTLNNNNYEWL